MLFDSAAALKPLLDACPGSAFVTTCRRCGERVDGPSVLDDRGFFVHPSPCERKPKPGQQELPL